MTIKLSTLALALSLVSSMFLGCAADAGEGAEDATQAAQAAEKAEAPHGYGYEMVALKLSSKDDAPKGDTLMNGRVAPEEIMRQAKARVPALKACYESALQREPGLKGAVTVKMSFAEDGSLRSANVEQGSIGDAELGNCVKGELGSMTLPATNAGPLQVIYPVELSPEDIAK